MRKNWLLFLKEINSKDNIIETDFIINDINLSHSDTPLEPFIDNWKKFFKKKIIEKNLDINKIKSRIYYNNKEAYYLKKYIKKNASWNMRGQSIDTYKFMDFINNLKHWMFFNINPRIFTEKYKNIPTNNDLPETIISFTDKEPEIPLFSKFGLVYHTGKTDENGDIILHVYQKNVINLKLIKSIIEKEFYDNTCKKLDDISENQIRIIQKNLKNKNNLLKSIIINLKDIHLKKNINTTFKENISTIIDIISYDEIKNDKFIQYYVKIFEHEFKIINNESNNLEILIFNDYQELEGNIKNSLYKILEKHKDNIHIKYENSTEELDPSLIKFKEKKVEICPKLKSIIGSQKIRITIIINSQIYKVFTKVRVKSKVYDSFFDDSHFLIYKNIFDESFRDNVPKKIFANIKSSKEKDLIIKNSKEFFKEIQMEDSKHIYNYIKREQEILDNEILFSKSYLFNALIRYQFLSEEINQKNYLDKIFKDISNMNSYQQYFDTFMAPDYFEVFQSTSSLINRYKNNSLDYWKVKFIDIFKDILYEFINNYNSDQTLENINEITSDIAKFSEKKILSDTEKRESLLKF